MVWPPVLCFGLLAIFSSHGVSPSDLWAAGPYPRMLCAVLCGVLGLGPALSALLWSSVALSRFARLSMLVLCLAVGAASLLCAQLVLLIWLFPTWYIFKYFRESSP